MWIEILEVLIPGQPVAMARPRVSKIGRNVKLYTPPRSKAWMVDAEEIIARAWNKIPIDKNIPIKLEAKFIHKRPKNRYRKKDPDDRYFKTTVPDLDNLEKILLDSIVYGGVLKDDSQVVAIESYDYYGAKHENPHVIFKLWMKNEIFDIPNNKNQDSPNS